MKLFALSKRAPRSGSGERGAALLYLIIILLMTGMIAVVITSLSSAVRTTAMLAGPASRAQFLAESGAEIGVLNYCSPEGELLDPGDIISLDLETGEFIQVQLVADAEGLWIEATATAHPGTRMQARAVARRAVPDCWEAETPEGPPGMHPGDYVLGGPGLFQAPSGATIDGSILATGIRLLAAGVTVSGDLVSGTFIQLESGTQIGGYVCAAEGDLILKSSGTLVAGDAVVFGDVDLGSGTAILGSVFATGNVRLRASNSLVGGSIHAGGDVVLESGTSVNGSVYAAGSVSILSSSVAVGGDIHCGANLTASSGTVAGSVLSGGDISFNAMQIGGEAHAGDRLFCGWGAISIAGGSYAGGTVNQYQPVRVLQPSPPRALPQAPLPPAGCPPPPPTPVLQSFSAGSNNVQVPQSTSVVVDPGAYRDLIFGGGATVTLKAGQCDLPGQPGCYVFRSFGPASWGQQLRLDLSGGGNIHVFIENNLSFSGPVFVSTDGISYQRIDQIPVEEAKELAQRVYWEVHGSVQIGTNNSIRHWLGTILSMGNISTPSAFFGVGAYQTTEGQIQMAAANPIIYFSIADFAIANWVPEDP